MGQMGKELTLKHLCLPRCNIQWICILQLGSFYHMHLLHPQHLRCSIFLVLLFLSSSLLNNSPMCLNHCRTQIFPNNHNSIYQILNLLSFPSAPHPYPNTAFQALLSMGFSRQEYWSGEPFPAPWISLAHYCLI